MALAALSVAAGYPKPVAVEEPAPAPPVALPARPQVADCNVPPPPLMPVPPDDCEPGIIQTIVGGDIGDGGPATEAAIGCHDVALGPDGSLYIADRWQSRVRRVDPQGTVTTAAGNGCGGYSGDGGPATDAMLCAPWGVAVSPDGSLYIAETDCHRVRKVDPGGVIATFAGDGWTHPPRTPREGDCACINEWPEGRYAGDGGPSAKASLSHPFGIEAGPDGSVYIADASNHRIRKVDGNGVITTVAGTGRHGYSGDGGRATRATLAAPEGVAVGNDGCLYIADTGNHRIRKVDAAGVITTVVGDGWPCEHADGRFRGDGESAMKASLSRPRGLVIAADGSMYIADWGNARIRKVDQRGVITTVAGGGEDPDLRGAESGPALKMSVWAGSGMAVAADGSLYLACSNRIRRLDRAGSLVTVAGSGDWRWTGDGTFFAGDGGAATEAHLSQPSGAAITTDAVLYIADTGNHRIRKVDRCGTITTVAGNGEVDQYGRGGFGGDGGPAVDARLNRPKCVAVGPDGSIYIADTGNYRIRKVDTRGVITTVAGDGALNWNQRGRFRGDGGPATKASLVEPSAIAIGRDGSVYIADWCRVRRIDPDGIITTVAGTGICRYAGDGGPAIKAMLNTIVSIALGPDGSIYITDSFEHRVRRIGVDGIITTVAGNGLCGDCGDGKPATDASLAEPHAVAVDPNGSIYIATGGRVRKICGGAPAPLR